MSEILIVSDAFLELKFHQIRFRPELCPGPRSGAYYNAPRPLSWLGRGTGTLLPIPSLLSRAFQWGPGIVECVGPTRWLIRPWGQRAPSPPARGSGERCKLPSGVRAEPLKILKLIENRIKAV